VARREIVVLEDDLDGGTADETVKFGIDGTNYEIDLSEANAQKLRDAFSAYIAGARKATRAGVVTGVRTAPRARGSAAADRDQNKAIRAWAKRKGEKISERGRIPQSLVDKYNAAAGR
jgi:Lsr2